MVGEGRGVMKNCWECVHLNWSNGSPGYSEMTPGYPPDLHCGKRHWEFDMECITEEHARKKLRTAETCTDFEQVEPK